MTTVIHVNTERTWRGGEAQVFHLARGIADYGFSSVIAAPLKSALLDKARNENLANVYLRSTGEFSYRQVFDLKRAVNKHNARIIHVHTAHGLISAGLVKKLFNPTIKIVYSRRTDFHLKTGFWGLSRKKYTLCPDRIVSVSDKIKHILISDGVPEKMITTVYSGIDPDAFNPDDDGMSIRNELNISPDHFVVGMVAALVKHKDPLTYLKAAETLSRSRPNVVFLLVGAGHLRENLTNALIDSPVQDQFIMTGFRRDVPDLLAAMDVFCMSSREEGLCTSILDAMAMAKPVVATNAGGIPEAVKDEETGFIVPVGDSNLMSEKLAILAENRALAKTMGLAGLNRVREIFNIRDTIKHTADVYRELLNEK